MQRLPCGNCGGKVPIPAGHAKAKIRCPHCGYYAEVPPEFRADPSAPPPPKSYPEVVIAEEEEDDWDWDADDDTEPVAPSREPVPASPVAKPNARPRVDPADTRPEFLVEEGSGVPLLAGTQDEDDDLPYAVPGTGLKPCPKCLVGLPLDAVFCVHCGLHLTKPGKKKPKRTYQPLFGRWHEGWSWETRLKIIVGLQVVNLVLIGSAIAWSEKNILDPGVWFTDLSMNMVNIFLQVFLVGSYDGFTIDRTEKGKTTMVKLRRIGFAKLAPVTVRWKENSGVGVLATHNPGTVAWMVFGYLLLFALMPGAFYLITSKITGLTVAVGVFLLIAGFVPAVGFYLMTIRPERFSVALCDEYRSVREVLFGSKSRDQATEIAQLVSEATALQYHNVL